MENNLTSIQVTKGTRKRLGDLGTRNDPNLEAVIIRLLEFYENNIK